MSSKAGVLPWRAFPSLLNRTRQREHAQVQAAWADRDGYGVAMDWLAHILPRVHIVQAGRLLRLKRRPTARPVQDRISARLDNRGPYWPSTDCFHEPAGAVI